LRWSCSCSFLIRSRNTISTWRQLHSLPSFLNCSIQVDTPQPRVAFVSPRNSTQSSEVGAPSWFNPNHTPVSVPNTQVDLCIAMPDYGTMRQPRRYIPSEKGYGTGYAIPSTISASRSASSLIHESAEPSPPPFSATI
jgi:hypothetical protein